MGVNGEDTRADPLSPDMFPHQRVVVWRQEGLVSRRDRPRFLIRCFPTATVQTRKHCDRQSSIQIHCSFWKHRSMAFIAGLHRCAL